LGGRIDIIQKVISDFFVDKLEDSDWFLLILTILEKYLSSLPQKDSQYSQVLILKTLDDISVPLGELVSFFASKMGVNFDPELPLHEAQIHSHHLQERGQLQTQQQTGQQGAIDD